MKKNIASKSAIIAYVPVLHDGYRQFFYKHSDVKILYLLGREIIQDFKQLTKDIRALPPEMIKLSLESWKIFDSIIILNKRDWNKLLDMAPELIMPDEDIMRELKDKYLSNVKVSFDPIFLRWDKHKSFINNPVDADQIVSKSDKDRKIIALLRKEAEKSSDAWRQIGAAIIKKGKILNIVHNHAVPIEQMPYIEGDPRSDFSKGIHVELSTSFHCEARLIAEAAQKGTSLEGTSLYVTTFPCPPCAKLIAYSGIKELYYSDGYGVLDGERILKSKGVKIIFVKNSE